MQRNLKMICKTITKQNKMLEGKDGQDDAHVGAKIGRASCRERVYVLV